MTHHDNQSDMLTVRTWLDVRARVAEQLKTEGSQQQAGTRERIAEGLMAAGFIDVVAVIEAIQHDEADEKARTTFAGGGDAS